MINQAAQGASASIFGVDEAGRGPLAGPVVAAAVWLGEVEIAGLNDSKKLSARRRALLEAEIKGRGLWAVGVAEADEIDRLNIFAATMLAMTRAVTGLITQGAPPPSMVLIDGNKTPEGRTPGWSWTAEAIVGGDGKVPCISAASIIAKEHRDRVMKALAQIHPGYGWERNAGYGTAEHMASLQKLGPSPQHRRSFAPVARLVPA